MRANFVGERHRPQHARLPREHSARSLNLASAASDVPVKLRDRPVQLAQKIQYPFERKRFFGSMHDVGCCHLSGL